ncbi:aminotransferase class V-fold PLP-dependent enzyme [Rubrivirga sp. IMCC43871]|uniref:aminotransferase class V-fold PLP-dependent enzyme n=1 Tax=Rubrivirga sp. IMCC43871 TaxID=3391575 RepID=UPI00398FFD27
MKRRDFFVRSSLALGAVPLLGARAHLGASPQTRAFDPDDWDSVRDQFPLTRDRVHMATFLLASHPRPVAEAIARHREAFDRDPVAHWEEHFQTVEMEQRQAAADYLETDPALIALTDSTTMGLGLVYGTLRLGPGDEVLTTPHDHYSTIYSLRHRAQRDGIAVREVALYDDPSQASVDEIVSRMTRAVTNRTRAVAVTWVHSSTGVKLPIAEMRRALDGINRDRDADERVLLCVDGVHGFGIEDVTVESLGADILMAGAHKWMFGPRGTGVIYASAEAWDRLAPVIPSFSPEVGVWLGVVPPEAVTPGDRFTPGGFHSFEHRWALGEAFRFHHSIGKDRIAARIHHLNTLAKDGLAEIPGLHMHTPRSPARSAGIIAFEMVGHTPDDIVAHLHERGITGSTSPYPVSYARIAPGTLNTEDEVMRTVATLAELA